MHKSNDINILDCVECVSTMERAGLKPGVTNIAKLLGCTNGKAKRLLNSAIRTGLILTYSHNYRPNVPRAIYGCTMLGVSVVMQVQTQTQNSLWSLCHED